jgi:dethiobiotin synthetase
LNGLFIAGTDTGCGKTAVGRALAAAARARGLCVRVLKPIETGCGPEGPADALALAAAAGDTRPVAELCPYALALPAAPQAAAAAEGVAIELERIRAAYHAARRGADLVLVEAAGGLRVPIAPDLDMAGLARALELPVLVVARAALGTLNHTKLTLEAAARAGLQVVGVLVSHTTPELPPAERANLDLLPGLIDVPLLGELPHAAQSSGNAPEAERHLDRVLTSLSQMFKRRP